MDRWINGWMERRWRLIGKLRLMDEWMDRSWRDDEVK